MRTVFLALALFACSGCSMMQPSGAVMPTALSDWRAVATPADRARLRDWRGAFIAALAAARGSGHGGEIDREGVLLQPDAALGGAIPGGNYKCRVIKVGAKSKGLLDYIAYPYFKCRVGQSNSVRDFAKLTGSQRPVGTIFPNDALRNVFLGTLMLGDEPRAMQYGVDQERDLAGFVERIGPDRWRLILPWPYFESKLDVIELVPTP